MMMQTIHTNANHISNIFKFYSFELVLIAALSSTEVESKHFSHALFLTTFLLKLSRKDFSKITQVQAVSRLPINSPFQNYI